jgi:hypothetical protein
MLGALGRALAGLEEAMPSQSAEKNAKLNCLFAKRDYPAMTGRRNKAAGRGIHPFANLPVFTYNIGLT